MPSTLTMYHPHQNLVVDQLLNQRNFRFLKFKINEVTRIFQNTCMVFFHKNYHWFYITQIREDSIKKMKGFYCRIFTVLFKKIRCKIYFQIHVLTHWQAQNKNQMSDYDRELIFIFSSTFSLYILRMHFVIIC